MLAAKASLALRVDALGEEVSADLGIEHRARLEMRLKALEEGYVRKFTHFSSLGISGYICNPTEALIS